MNGLNVNDLDFSVHPSTGSLKKQLFCGRKIMNLPTTKNSSNSEKHGCFLATPCHARGAYFAQGERKNR